MLVTITVKPLVANAVSAVFLRPENFLPLLGGQTKENDRLDQRQSNVPTIRSS
jgi:hypothetical protein